MKILVTGAPGTGKTFLVQRAQDIGRDNFYDTDAVKGLCEWRNYATGKVIGPVEHVKPIGGEVWYETNGWYWIKSKMDELTAGVTNPVVCGSADNVMEFYDYFDRIILLYKSREDIVSNLMQPGREQQNGKDPRHHERILKWQNKLLETTKPHNPVIIKDNNIQSVFQKIDELIKS